MAAVEQISPVAEARQKAVAETIRRIRRIEEGEGVSPATLEKIKAEMMKLADRKDLFPESDFPHPEGKEDHTRYLVHEEPNERFVLYMNSMKPGKQAAPHDHSETWAVVVAIQGEEENVLWKVLEEDMAAGKAKIEPDVSVTVQPGTGVAIMPRQIHSIAIKGAEPTMHLHLYGQALEGLGPRRGYNPERGTMFEFKSHGQTVGKS